MWCDCEDEGRDAYKYSRHSYETWHRLNEGRYGGNECDREFANGYREEERRDERERDEQEERDARYAAQQRASEQAAYYEEQAYYESQMAYDCRYPEPPYPEPEQPED